MRNQASIEHEIENLYNTSFQNLLKLWDGNPVLHAYHFSDDIDDDDYAAAERTSEVLATEAGINSSSYILDVGCGCGSFLFYVAKRYLCSGVGIDLSSEHVKFAQEKLITEDVHNIEFSHASATQIPYEASRFTHVISQDALYLVPDKPRSHAEIYRVLQPGGIFAFCDFIQPIKAISERVRILVYDRLRYNNGYSITEYQQVLEEAGFEILLSQDLQSHFLKTYRSLALKARSRANELTDLGLRSLMLHYCASCIETYKAVSSNELGWGMFIAQKPVG